MPIKDPHFRIYEALDITAGKAKQKPSDKRVATLVDILSGKNKDPDLTYAWELFQEDRIRRSLDAFFIGDAMLDVIRRATDIPMPVLQRYNEYFFDTSVFRNRLERLVYIDNVSMYGDKQEAEYLQVAMCSGPAYLTWLLRGKVDLKPKDYLEAHMVDSFFRGQAHRAVPIDSPIGREARVWGENGVRSALALHKIDPQEETNALEQLRLALRHEDVSLTADSKGAPAPEDILH